MKILTKRNAMLGWATFKTAKGVAKYYKAKGSLPATPGSAAKKKKAKRKRVVAGALAALGSVALLKKLRRRKPQTGESPSSTGSE
jgi:hypothetical protein